MMEKRKYIGFKNWNDILEDFDALTTIPEPEYVYSLYITPPYEGYATVVFKDYTGWHLVIGSHCSCHGLEGQWSIEDFDPEIFFKGKQEGRTILKVEDHYYSNSEKATQENFEEWLAFATTD